MKSTHCISKRNLLHYFINNVLISYPLLNNKYIYIYIYVNYQRPKRSVTEGQQTSDNVHRSMLHRHKKPLHQ